LFRKSNYDSGKLERLGYCPDSVFLEKFWKLCAEMFNTSGDSLFCFSTNPCHFLIFQITYYLFLPDFDTDETDEEDENKEYIEETNRDVSVIAACKLVASDVVPKVLTKCILHCCYYYLSNVLTPI